MPTVTWSNGQADHADTWEELEARVRDTQWRNYTADGFRTAMAKRAWRWSRVNVDVDVDAETFFRELEHAKLVVIDRPDKAECRCGYTPSQCAETCGHEDSRCDCHRVAR